MRNLRVVSALLILVIALLTANPAAAQPRMIDLGTLGGDRSGALDINLRGQIVGFSNMSSGGPDHAFLWQGGRMTDLGTLGGPGSLARSINIRGQIVGRSYTTDSLHATLWHRGRITDLGTLKGGYSEAYAINDLGHVVGLSDGEVFLYEGGRMRGLGTLGWREVVPFAMNNRGQIAGWGVTPEGNLRGFLWNRGLMAELPTLGGNISQAYGINDRGQAVGVATLAPNEYFHAVLWERGSVIDLGTLPGSNSGIALDINNRAQVVGAAPGFFWEDRNMTPLPTLGGSSSEGRAINDRGHVVGQSYTSSGELHAFLWTR